MRVEIIPLESVVVQGTPVCFGMRQSAVERAIGKGQLAGKRYYYFDNEMAIDYGPDGTVEFIEFLGGIDGALRPEIYGVSAFDTAADALADLLRQKNGEAAADPEQGYSLVFLNLSVGVYRELRPSDVQEMMEEMKADGIPVENHPDVTADLRKANHWSTIGAGAAGYYLK